MVPFSHSLPLENARLGSCRHLAFIFLVYSAKEPSPVSTFGPSEQGVQLGIVNCLGW